MLISSLVQVSEGVGEKGRRPLNPPVIAASTNAWESACFMFIQKHIDDSKSGEDKRNGAESQQLFHQRDNMFQVQASMKHNVMQYIKHAPR